MESAVVPGVREQIGPRTLQSQGAECRGTEHSNDEFRDNEPLTEEGEIDRGDLSNVDHGAAPVR
jgi:hypothetical protein